MLFLQFWEAKHPDIAYGLIRVIRLLMTAIFHTYNCLTTSHLSCIPTILFCLSILPLLQPMFKFGSLDLTVNILPTEKIFWFPLPTERHVLFQNFKYFI